MLQCNFKTSPTVHNEECTDPSRVIKMVLYDNHYMIDEFLLISYYCLTHFSEACAKGSFLINEKVEPAHGCHICTALAVMKKNGMLVPMSDDEICKLNYSYKDNIFDDALVFNKTRMLHAPPVNTNDNFKRSAHHGAFLFGYKPDDEDEAKQLHVLQQVIDDLPLRHHIDVKYYYKFSLLMQHVMEEYGCFDDVYESSGIENITVRNSLVFPKVMNYVEEASGKLYYIDLNSACMSCVDGIPYTLHSDESEMNTKIVDLIHTLYDIRKKAKAEGNVKLATTLKFMMSSCYGYSMKRPSIIKNKYTNDVNKCIDEFAPYIVSYKYNEDHITGKVTMINPYVPSFNYVQFAKRILDNYNTLMTNIKSQVNVLFENIDAILVTEDDFNKLKQLGYVGDALGQFKIDKVFTDIHFVTPRKWYATCLDGSEFRHQM